VTERPRFLVAKYTPDVFRNEPRNIGVVLWSPGGVLARFIGEPAEPGDEWDEACIPSFVASPAAYKQWVRYWRREIGKPAIRPSTGGALVPATSPAFLEALRQSGPRNYVLADGGTFAEPIPPRELPSALDDLYADCVGLVPYTSHVDPLMSASFNMAPLSGSAADLGGPFFDPVAANSLTSQLVSPPPGTPAGDAEPR
jgi:hypothetical protein